MVEAESCGAARRAGLLSVVLPALGALMGPVLALAAALALSGLVVLAVGEDPWAALRVLVSGALGSPEAVGYTLYYTTSFVFAGLAVAVAFHAGLFNIGGEGQAMLGGLGAGLAALALDGWPWPVVAVAGVGLAALFGAGWAFLPGWLQARRGSHIVITTIMFNFLASALMTWLLVDVLRAPGQQAPETRSFAETSWLPDAGRVLGWLGLGGWFDPGAAPLNLSFPLALLCAIAVTVFLWHTRWGYELRVVGANRQAAVYAGISPAAAIIGAMLLSGALAGLVGVNEILGVQHRLLLDFTGGVGFVGIAVALMGRNHPGGVVPAALLFGILAQGGSELSFEFSAIDRDLVVVIQGLVVLFSAALERGIRIRVPGARKTE